MQSESHEFIEGTSFVQIIAHGLEMAIAGFDVSLIRNADEEEYFEQEITKKLRNTLTIRGLSNQGVYFQAPTIGSSEAFLKVLQNFKIPVSYSFYLLLCIGRKRSKIIRISMPE